LPTTNADELRALADAAIGLPGIESAVIFATTGSPTDLELVAAAGVEGPPLERLAEAVRNPAHSIARTAAQAKAEFDVTPIGPGGPALRSHLPLLTDDADGSTVLGVLAVAHQESLDQETRRRLADLAAAAAQLLSPRNQAA
jgi:hypothetical protein